MGQNSVNLVGWLVFGMREILVLLMSDIDRLELRTFSIMFKTLGPTIFQYL